MASTMRQVNSLVASSDSSAAELAKVILDDYALTDKVLRVVNSVIYGRPTPVTTVSRAIVVLGWNPIQQLVLTLKLFDSLPETTDAEAGRALMGQSFCTGMVARNVAATFEAQRYEEAFICGLFHQFGELLVHFYLPEQKQEIVKLITERQRKPSAAVKLVLGMTYPDIATSVAQELCFPKLLLACMQRTPRIKRSGQATPLERMAGLTAFSGRVKDVLLGNELPAKTRPAIEALFEGFEKEYGPIGALPEEVINQTITNLEDHASIMGLHVHPAALVKQISQAYFERPGKKVEREDVAEGRPSSAPLPLEVLKQGIEEASRAGPRTLNDLLTIVLETMFRGMTFAPVAHALFLLRDPSHPRLMYRCGFGDNLEDAADWLNLPLNEGRDVFNLAIAQRKDLAIADVSSIGVSAIYPKVLYNWVQPSGYAVVLPLVVKDRPIGVFFIEGQAPHNFEAEQLALLKGLRDQVVTRIENAQFAA